MFVGDSGNILLS